MVTMWIMIIINIKLDFAADISFHNSVHSSGNYSFHRFMNNDNIL